MTIAVLPVPEDQVSAFGIVRLDDGGRVVGFEEKPKNAEQLPPLRTSLEWIKKRGVEPRGRQYLASMGIYLFNRDVLLELLNARPPATDFGKEIFPQSIQPRRVQAYLFDGYWEDLGTVKSYHEANLALASNDPPFNFHSPEGVIYTRMRFLPASRICDATLDECLVSDGCVVESGTKLERCVLGVRSRIGRDVTIRDTVILGADRFETDAERADNQKRGVPNFTVGDGTVIEGAIIDKDTRIGRNVRILHRRGREDAETDYHVIRDGVVVIPKGAVVPDGTVI